MPISANAITIIKAAKSSCKKVFIEISDTISDIVVVKGQLITIKQATKADGEVIDILYINSNGSSIQITGDTIDVNYKLKYRIYDEDDKDITGSFIIQKTQKITQENNIKTKPLFVWKNPFKKEKK